MIPSIPKLPKTPTAKVLFASKHIVLFHFIFQVYTNTVVFLYLFSRGRIGQFRGVRQGLVGSGARSGRRGQGKERRSLPRRLHFQQEEEDQSQTIYTPVEEQVSIRNRFNILTRIFTYSGRIYLQSVVVCYIIVIVIFIIVIVITVNVIIVRALLASALNIVNFPALFLRLLRILQVQR